MGNYYNILTDTYNLNSLTNDYRLQPDKMPCIGIVVLSEYNTSVEEYDKINMWDFNLILKNVEVENYTVIATIFRAQCNGHKSYRKLKARYKVGSL